MSELDTVAALISDHVQDAFVVRADELFSRQVINGACYGDENVFWKAVMWSFSKGVVGIEWTGPKGKKVVWLKAGRVPKERGPLGG